MCKIDLLQFKIILDRPISLGSNINFSVMRFECLEIKLFAKREWKERIYVPKRILKQGEIIGSQIF